MAKYSRRRNAKFSFPKQINPIWLIIAIVLLVLIVSFIIYAVNQPENKPFRGIEPVETLAETQSALPTAEGMVGAAANSATTKSNPVTDMLNALQARWDTANQTMMAQKNSKDLSYAFVVMDICRADILQDVSAFSTLSTEELQNGSAAQGLLLAADPANPQVYDFSMTTKQGYALSGKVNNQDQSLYYIVKNIEGKTVRYLDAVNKNGEYFLQLLVSEGPYKGVLFFNLLPDGSVRAAYMSDEMYRESGGLSTAYDHPPASWEQFSAKAAPFFSALASESSAVSSQQDTDASLNPNTLDNPSAVEQAAPDTAGDASNMAAPQATPQPSSYAPPPVGIEEGAIPQQDMPQGLPEMDEAW